MDGFLRAFLAGFDKASNVCFSRWIPEFESADLIAIAILKLFMLSRACEDVSGSKSATTRDANETSRHGSYLGYEQELLDHLLSTLEARGSHDHRAALARELVKVLNECQHIRGAVAELWLTPCQVLELDGLRAMMRRR